MAGTVTNVLNHHLLLYYTPKALIGGIRVFCGNRHLLDTNIYTSQFLEIWKIITGVLLRWKGWESLI